MNRRKRRRLLMLGSSAFAAAGGGPSAPPIPAQTSLFFAGQSLAEYPFFRGTPRIVTTLITGLRPLLGYSESGTPTVYSSGTFCHDGSAEGASDWTIRLDNCASGGSALLDVSQSGSQIASGNYWWNTQDNTATNDPEDVADSPGPLWRALITRMTAGDPTGFVWSQGTTDMTSDSGLLTTYKTVLKALFAAVRVAAGSDIPIFVLRIGRHQTGQDIGAEPIRRIQREVQAEMTGIYVGAEEYPYRMAATEAYPNAGITSGSNVITLNPTTNWSASDGIVGPGIPEGSFVRAASGIVLNTSLTIAITQNGSSLPSLATATGTETIYRLDNVHLYPGSDGIEPLDGPGGTVHKVTDGFYAVMTALGQRIAQYYGAVASGEGPYLSAITAFTGNNKIRATLTHGAGNDLVSGGATGWRVEMDDVANNVISAHKVSATEIDLLLSSVVAGTTIEAQYAYGAMNRANPARFSFDNEGFPIQARAAIAAPAVIPSAGPGISNTGFLNSQVDAVDRNMYTFDGTGADDGRIYLGIGARGSTSFIHPLILINGIAATQLATQTSGSGGVARTSMFVADVPAGATGGIVIRIANTSFIPIDVLRCGIALWKPSGVNPNRVVFDAGSTVTDAAGIPLTAPANGAALIYGFCAHTAGVTATIGGGLTENVDQAIEGTTMFHAGGSGLVSGAVSPSIDWSATPVNGLGTVAVAIG